MKASAGTGNRKGKRIPRKNLFAGSGTFLHNESMKIETDEEDTVTESDVVETLIDAYEGYADINDMEVKIQGTFEGLGMLTRNQGFVFRVGNQEFQVSVVER